MQIVYINIQLIIEIKFINCTLHRLGCPNTKKLKQIKRENTEPAYFIRVTNKAFISQGNSSNGIFVLWKDKKFPCRRWKTFINPRYRVGKERYTEKERNREIYIYKRREQSSLLWREDITSSETRGNCQCPDEGNSNSGQMDS